jgi:hypothetical protein
MAQMPHVEHALDELPREALRRLSEQAAASKPSTSKLAASNLAE